MQHRVLADAVADHDSAVEGNVARFPREPNAELAPWLLTPNVDVLRRLLLLPNLVAVVESAAFTRQLVHVVHEALYVFHRLAAPLPEELVVDQSLDLLVAPALLGWARILARAFDPR